MSSAGSSSSRAAPAGWSAAASPEPRSVFATSADADLDLYIASGEWHDRAGAYAIQGLGSILIEELRGDFSNVVGLPIALLLQLAPNLLEKPENPKANI